MIVLNMPGGAVQVVDPKKLLWMRESLADERSNAVTLLIAGDRLYSIEALDQLKEKFSGGGIAIASFTPPVGRIEIAVNAAAVQQVDTGNPKIYHEKARAVLVFSPKLKLAVREDAQQARDKLKAARDSAKPSTRVAARAGRRGAAHA